MTQFSVKCWKHVDVSGLPGDPASPIFGAELAKGTARELIVNGGTSTDTPLAFSQVCNSAENINQGFAPGSVIMPIVTLRARENAGKTIVLGVIKSANGETTEGFVFSSGDIDPAEVFERATDLPLDTAHSASFLRGTMIDTPHGAIAIEHLEDGDEVMRRDGAIQLITGLNRQRYSGLELALSPHLIPVRIMAGALTGGRPGQDLLVAQDHRLLVDDWRAAYLFGEEEILVPAKSLLNNRTVVLEDIRAGVEYLDISVADGGLVCANGLWAETQGHVADVNDLPIPALSHSSPQARVA